MTAAELERATLRDLRRCPARVARTRRSDPLDPVTDAALRRAAEALATAL